jgi:hypothetical protein
MRTTIRIDDDLYRAVKEQAARSGRTVSAVLEDAVRIGMRTVGRRDVAPYVPQPSGTGGVQPGVDLSSNASAAEALDSETPLVALR